MTEHIHHAYDMVLQGHFVGHGRFVAFPFRWFHVVLGPLWYPLLCISALIFLIFGLGIFSIEYSHSGLHYIIKCIMYGVFLSWYKLILGISFLSFIFL